MSILDYKKIVVIVEYAEVSKAMTPNRDRNLSEEYIVPTK